ncbi:MAG: FAD binding domain-containing protein [Anaerolineae bacterium]|nr:FAD binding domain-containing protein [Anaerolineae bacterium]
MLPKFREYHRPKSLDEAMTLLGRPNVRTVPLAGGSALLPNPDPTIQAVVDLQALPLDQVEWTADSLCVGAMVRLQALVEDPGVRAFAQGLVAQAARQSAPLLTRNAATVGGCVAVADPLDPLLLAFLTLRARVRYRMPEPREQPLDQFLEERGALLGRGALITQVLMAHPGSRAGTALLKVARTPSDHPILAGAACLSLDASGACQSATVAMGGLGPVPVRLHGIEALLPGEPLDDAALAHAVERIRWPPTAPDDARASGQYRLEVAPVLLRRLLQTAWQRAARLPSPEEE